MNALALCPANAVGASTKDYTPVDAAGKKAELLSDDWDTIAQYLLGEGATGKDLR